MPENIFSLFFSNISNHLKIVILEISTIDRYREISLSSYFPLSRIPITWILALVLLASIFVSFYLTFFTSLSFPSPFWEQTVERVCSFRSLICPPDFHSAIYFFYSILYFTTILSFIFVWWCGFSSPAAAQVSVLGSAAPAPGKKQAGDPRGVIRQPCGSDGEQGGGATVQGELVLTRVPRLLAALPDPALEAAGSGGARTVRPAAAVTRVAVSRARTPAAPFLFHPPGPRSAVRFLPGGAALPGRSPRARCLSAWVPHLFLGSASASNCKRPCPEVETGLGSIF